MANPPPSVQTVAVVGTGLIGGSILHALRDAWPGVRRLAVDVSGVAEQAVALGLADAVATVDEAAAADLVVLAAPPEASQHALGRLAPRLHADTIVTDVASVKAPMVETARRVLPNVAAFVGGHPMAGAERGGLAHARSDLFENAAWVLCPPGGELDAHHAPVVALVEACRARPVVLDAADHDAFVARVSHLPQLAAVALVNAALADEPAARQLAAGGFRDMTRIASSPVGLWQEIFAANRPAVLRALDRYADVLADLRRAVETGDDRVLARCFDEAAEARAGLPVSAKGFLRPLAELTLDADDRVGFLARALAVLADADLDLKDVELLKVREGHDGVFRLAFASDGEAIRALAVLRADGFTARLR